MRAGVSSKSYLFGSVRLRREPGATKNQVEMRFGRLALVLSLTLVLLYGCGVGAAYYWIKYARNTESVTWTDVALLRWKSVRRTLGLQQFAQAKTEWDERNFQGAYLSFSTALRNAPDDISGRLSAADFLNTMGMTSMAVNVLQDGLLLNPQDRALGEKTLALLTSTGRDQQALDLIRNRLGRELHGSSAALFRSYEVVATLNLSGAIEAKRLLDAHPEILEVRDGVLIAARILWELHDKLAAIELVQRHLKKNPGEYRTYVQLATYQETAGLIFDARETADAALRRFPDEIQSHLLWLGAHAPAKTEDSATFHQQIGDYFIRFKTNIDALALLGELAGKKGWVGLARSLYEVSATRGQNPRLMGLYYSDALARRQRFKEAQQVLAELESQSEDGGQFSLALRQRQVMVAAGRGITDDVRDAARRMAASLQRDPEMRETYRRRFQSLGIPAAAAELTAVSYAPKATSNR